MARPLPQGIRRGREPQSDPSKKTRREDLAGKLEAAHDALVKSVSVRPPIGNLPRRTSCKSFPDNPGALRPQGGTLHRPVPPAAPSLLATGDDGAVHQLHPLAHRVTRIIALGDGPVSAVLHAHGHPVGAVGTLILLDLVANVGPA